MANTSEGSAGIRNEPAPGHSGICPYCKESINPEAVICKHCRSPLAVEPRSPSHGGTCPYCREVIHEDAVVCKHCRSVVADQTIFLPTALPFGDETFIPDWINATAQEFGVFDDDEQLPDGDGFGAALSSRLQVGGLGGSPGNIKIRCRWIKGTICDAQGNCRPWWVRRCTIESAIS